MRVRKYNKLVRDNIPEIIEASGKECDTVVLDDDEYIIKLKEKLEEEAREVIDARDNEITGELADVLEIVEAIEKFYGIDHDAVLEKKESKAQTNGKFEKKILLKETRQLLDESEIGMDTSIKDLGFSIRVSNALCRAGYETVEDLIKIKLSDVAYIRNMGIVGVDNFIQEMERLEIPYIDDLQFKKTHKFIWPKKTGLYW